MLFLIVFVGLALGVTTVSSLLVRAPSNSKIPVKLSKLKMSSGDAPVIEGIGDDGCKLPSPSRINTLPEPFQFAVFTAISGALYVGTGASVDGIHFLQQLAPQAMGTWMSTWPLLGLIYAAAGVAHFTVCEEFMNMMPAPGSWGFWYLVGSKRFHVLWTGVAEIVGGLLLFLGGAANLLGMNVPLLGPQVASNGALLLLALTILVTPANIYMYTHGAKLPMSGPAIPVSFHYIRLSVQIVLFAFLYILAEPALKQLI